MITFKKEHIKKIINTAIAFITALFILLSAFSGAAAILTSKPYILYTVGSTKYLQNAEQVLKDGLSSLAIPSGLPEDFFDDKINTEKLYSINREFMISCYDTGAAKINTDDLKQELINTFKDYAASGAVASTVDIDDDALSYLANKCVEQYMTVGANSIFRYICIYASKANRYTIYALIFIIIFSVLGILFLIKLSGDGDKKYLYFSLCGGGCMSAILPLILLIGRFIGRLNIPSKAMRTFISAYLNNALIILSVFGLLLIAVSIFILWRERHSAPKFEQSEKNT